MLLVNFYVTATSQIEGATAAIRGVKNAETDAPPLKKGIALGETIEGDEAVAAARRFRG